MRSASRPQAKGRTWSLAARLTAWYVLSSFSLVLIVTGVLYWAVVNGLAYEDSQTLLDKVHVLRGLLAAPHPDEQGITLEIGEDATAPRRAYARILSASGRMLYQSPGMAAVLPQRLFPAPPPLRAQLGRGVRIRSSVGRSFQVLSARVAYGGGERDAVIQVATDVTADEELLARYRTVLGVLLGLALLACAGAGYQMVHAGLRPVRRIAQAADAIGSSTLDKRLDVAALPAELRDLATTFNGMLGRLEDSFLRLRRFSDDIAHELRTPVNRMLVATEVALGRARKVEEYREVLASNIEDFGRLSRLVQSLLFLARSESPHAHIEKERVDLAHELAAIREFYEAAASEAGVGLSVMCDPGLVAELDRSLLQRAVGNLVENAMAHTPRGGSIVIAGRDDGASLTIDVSDTGCGIAAEHLPHLFDRFYRTDGDRPTRGGNAGLGLSIVRSIASLHGGGVEIASTVNEGTRVALHLPKPSRPDDEIVIRSSSSRQMLFGIKAAQSVRDAPD